MRIELLCSVASERRGWKKGDVVEFEDGYAKRLIARGDAVPSEKPLTPDPVESVGTAPKPAETAKVEPPAKADNRPAAKDRVAAK